MNYINNSLKSYKSKLYQMYDPFTSSKKIVSFMVAVAPPESLISSTFQYNTLLIKNLPDDVAINDIRSIFSKAGTIKFIYLKVRSIQYKVTYAIVEFQQNLQAEKAIRYFDNRQMGSMNLSVTPFKQRVDLRSIFKDCIQEQQQQKREKKTKLIFRYKDKEKCQKMKNYIRQRCYNCRSYAHLVRNCPNTTSSTNNLKNKFTKLFCQKCFSTNHNTIVCSQKESVIEKLRLKLEQIDFVKKDSELTNKQNIQKQQKMQNQMSEQTFELPPRCHKCNFYGHGSESCESQNDEFNFLKKQNYQNLKLKLEEFDLSNLSCFSDLKYQYS